MQSQFDRMGLARALMQVLICKNPEPEIFEQLDQYAEIQKLSGEGTMLKNHQTRLRSIPQSLCIIQPLERE